MKKLNRLLFLLPLFLLGFVSIDAQVFTEDFDGSSPVTPTLSPASCLDTGSDYFDIVDVTQINPVFVGVNGNFLAAQDTNDPDCPSPSSNVSALWTGINIAGNTNLTVCLDIAEGDATNGDEDWDASSSVVLSATVDGGTATQLQFSGGGATNTEPGLDTNCDGTQDGQILTNNFSTFCVDITATGSLMDILIEINDLNDGDEDVAIDNITVYSAETTAAPVASSPSCGVAPCSITSVFVNNGMCTGSDFSYDVNFIANNGSGMYDVVDNATSTILGTGTTSPITITITGNTSTTPFDIFVQDNMDPTCNSSAAPTSVTPIDCSLITICVNQGDLVITEFMQNPSAVGDGDGEWFEVYNPTANPIDMFGYVISDAGSDNFTVNASVVVPAGGYVVFVEEGDMTLNGGIAGDYDYSGMSLANGDDEIIISCGGVVIDSVYYDGGPNYPDPTGASASLNPGGDASTNDMGSNWCEATSAYGSGDLGTPGTANDACGSTCPPDYDAANALTGMETGTGGVNSDGDYETDGIISSNQMITSGMVDYDSAVEINLTADFEVVLGAVFCAFIDGCNGMGGVVNPATDNDNTNALQTNDEEMLEQKSEK